MKVFAVIALATALAGCATVRQQDLDSWAGMPVEALDTHSLFLTVPMVRTISASGIEIRNYANGIESASCYTSGGASKSSGKYVNTSAFTTCSNNKVVCNNLFYIREGRVIEYAPTGRCYTDATVQPQARYKALLRN
jgi:hypothetical protein